MEKKTHVAAAIALSSVLLSPANNKMLALTLISTTIGGLIPDIDITTSESHKDVALISTVSLTSILVAILADIKYNFGLIELFKNNTDYLSTLIAVILFILVCNHGMHTPHRSFMHSIPCLVILTTLIFFLFPLATIPFFIGMASHIFLDLFNLKKLQLLYPFDLRVGFNLVPSNGFVNSLLCIIFLFISFIAT